ncbi:MAG: hypothetical protein AB2L14_37950 [Candidatus Xenobiia bacterium LiM19]
MLASNSTFSEINNVVYSAKITRGALSHLAQKPCKDIQLSQMRADVIDINGVPGADIKTYKENLLRTRHELADPALNFDYQVVKEQAGKIHAEVVTSDEARELSDLKNLKPGVDKLGYSKVVVFLQESKIIREAQGSLDEFVQNMIPDKKDVTWAIDTVNDEFLIYEPSGIKMINRHPAALKGLNGPRFQQSSDICALSKDILRKDKAIHDFAESDRAFNKMLSEIVSNSKATDDEKTLAQFGLNIEGSMHSLSSSKARRYILSALSQPLTGSLPQALIDTTLSALNTVDSYSDNDGTALISNCFEMLEGMKGLSDKELALVKLGLSCRDIYQWGQRKVFSEVLKAIENPSNDSVPSTIAKVCLSAFENENFHTDVANTVLKHGFDMIELTAASFTNEKAFAEMRKLINGGFDINLELMKDIASSTSGGSISQLQLQTSLKLAEKIMENPGKYYSIIEMNYKRADDILKSGLEMYLKDPGRTDDEKVIAGIGWDVTDGLYEQGHISTNGLAIMRLAIVRELCTSQSGPVVERAARTSIDIADMLKSREREAAFSLYLGFQTIFNEPSSTDHQKNLALFGANISQYTGSHEDGCKSRKAVMEIMKSTPAPGESEAIALTSFILDMAKKANTTGAKEGILVSGLTTLWGGEGIPVEIRRVASEAHDKLKKMYASSNASIYNDVTQPRVVYMITDFMEDLLDIYQGLENLSGNGHHDSNIQEVDGEYVVIGGIKLEMKKEK